VAGLIKLLTLLVQTLILEGPNPKPLKVSQARRHRRRPRRQRNDGVGVGGVGQEEYLEFIQLQPTMGLVLGLLFVSLQQSLLTEPLVRALEVLLYGRHTVVQALPPTAVRTPGGQPRPTGCPAESGGGGLGALVCALSQ
jgi:hypothetical protein